MAWSPEDRRKFLRGLDDTESVLLVFYKYLLYFLIVSVTLLAAYFFRAVSSDSFRDFLRIYGGILYLTFLAWSVGQLLLIRNRQSRGPSGWNTPRRAERQHYSHQGNTTICGNSVLFCWEL